MPLRPFAGIPRAAIIAGIPLIAFVITIGLTLAKSGSEGSVGALPAATVGVSVQQSAAPATPPPPATLAPIVVTTLRDRGSCAEISGSPYRSVDERDWFLRNCSAPSAAASGAQNANATARATTTGPGPLYGTGDRLVYSRLGINAPVNGRSVGSDGVMGDPAGPTDVVWYDFGGLGLGGYPGIGGNAVFAGHVDYRNYGPAVFYQLRNVQAGDLIEYHTAAGGYFKYQVQSAVDYAPDANWAALVSGENLLTLITCNGEFNSAAREYSHRRVVRAVLVQ